MTARSFCVLVLQAVEDMCLHKFAAGLYQNLHDACDRHIASQLAQLRRHQSPDPLVFLGGERW